MGTMGFVSHTRFNRSSCTLRTARVCADASVHVYRKDAQNDPELVKTARAYAEAMDDGEIEEDEIVAKLMGAKDSESLSDVQTMYKDKVKAQIAKKAQELESRSGAGKEEFDYGTQLYARGRYAESERVLAKALDMADPFGKLGGDIQIQLALSLSANGKEQDCIDVLKNLEQTHPMPAVRTQAKNLAFIMEAPKLQVREEERVQVPEFSNIQDNIKKRGPQRRPAPPRQPLSAGPKKPKSFEDEFWENYSPPKYLTNKYVWAAASIIGLIAAYYSYLYKDCIPQTF